MSASALVQVTVLSNEEGASFEDVVYDRHLRLRTEGGQVLQVFDPGVPLSGEVPVGSRCEVALAAPLAAQVRAQGPAAADEWRGQIVALEVAAPGPSVRARPEFTEQPWAVVATPVGAILLPRRLVPPSAAVGGTLCFRPGRIDLYAVR